MRLTALISKWDIAAALAVLLLSVALTAYTGNIFFLAAPIALVFMLTVGLNWKTAYWVFLCSIPASVQINFAGDTMSITLPDQPMMWLFLLVFITLIARNPEIIPKWWFKDELVLISFLQYLWLIVAVIYSTVPFFSFKFLIAKTWLVVCYVIMPYFIFKTKRDFKRSFWLVFIPTLITIIVILIHHALLGFRFEKVQASMSGLYYNHVDYSSVISMFFPMLLVAWPLTKQWGRWVRLLLALAIIIFMLGITFAYARAAVLAVVFAIVVGFATKLRLVNAIMPAFYAAIIALFLYMVPNNKFLSFSPDYNNTYMHKDFADHVIATFRGKDMSSMERLYRWIAAVRMSRAEPLHGYGPHGFYYNYKPYAISRFKTYVSRNPERSTTHNYFLYMLVEQGWPAMLLYALLIPAIFAKAQRVYHRFQDKFYKGVTLGLLMMISAGFINNFFSELIETHKVGAFFYIPMALLIILDRMSKEQADTSPAKAITTN
jgi:O-antigen ligase